MTNRRVYLDYNATAPLRPQARDAMLAALATLGNPSSVHAEGRASRDLLEGARAKIASHIGAAPKNLLFTSSATEAANLTLTPHLQRGRNPAAFDALLLSGGEHACLRSGHRFPAHSVEILPLTAQGQLELDALEEALKRFSGRSVMVAVQAANNETGVLQPVKAAAELVHAYGGLLVCDATQAIGREGGFATLGADVLFFSSHKLGGPSGAGALAFARDDLHIRETLLRGGGQENGRRAGTENVAAVVGFAAALEATRAAGDSKSLRLAALRDRIETQILALAPEAEILGAEAARLDNTTAFVSGDAPAQTLAMALDLEGVATSAGAACSSGKLGHSHVLRAMGRKETAALRISLGWCSSAEDVDLFGAAFALVVGRIKSRRPAG